MSDNSDVAALSASAIAVIVSISVASGEYNALSLGVSLTVLSMIVGYGLSRKRTRMMSVAFSFVVALSLMPCIGFLDDALRSRKPLRYLTLNYEWQCHVPKNPDPCKSDGSHDTRVPDRDLAFAWLIIVFGTFYYDRGLQRRTCAYDMEWPT